MTAERWRATMIPLCGEAATRREFTFECVVVGCARFPTALQYVSRRPQRNLSDDI